MMIRFASTVLFSCLAVAPVSSKIVTTEDDVKPQIASPQRHLFRERDLCRCEASWEVAGVEAYYDYSTATIRNGYEVVAGLFVLESADPLCSAGSSAATDDAITNDDEVGHRYLMGNESVALYPQIMVGGDEGVDTVERDLHTGGSSYTRGGPRALQTSKGGRGRGRPSTLQTGKGGSPSTLQTGKGGGTSTLQTGKGGTPSTLQTGKGSGPNVETLDADECFADDGAIPACCFDGCSGRPVGIDQPSGTDCQTCDCDCPPIPSVFPCPVTPEPQPESTIQEATPCAMSVTAECFRKGRNGKRRTCNDIRPMQFLQCSCPNGCASAFEFKYTAKGCGVPVDGATNCRDYGGEIPENVGVIGTIRGREFYYNPNVNKDDILTFQDGTCIKNEMSLSVVDRDDRERVLLTIDLFTKCSADGIQLGDRVGAFEFTAYECHDGTIQDCIKNLSFEVCAVNEKASSLSLQAMELDFKGTLNNLLSDVTSQSVEANDASCFEERRAISICKRNLQFEYKVYAEGREMNFGSNGSDVQSNALSCSAEASARFEVDPPGLPPVEPEIEIRQATSRPTQEPEPTREPRRDDDENFGQGKGGGGGARGNGEERYYGRARGRGRGGRARGRNYGLGYALGKGF